MARKTPLQQLRASRNAPKKQMKKEKKLIEENKKTPLTRSQQNPQTRRLAAMEALRKPVPGQNERFIDPNQLTLADAPNGQEFLKEHNESASAMRSAAVDNFRFEADNTRRPKFTRTLRKPFEKRGTPVVNPEQLRGDLTNTGLSNQALEALGTTVYATNKLPSTYDGVFVSGNSQSAFSRRGKVGISSTKHKDMPSTRRFVLAHELGHEAESMARGRVGYGLGDRELKEDGELGPSASGEGFADGIGLRFHSKDAAQPTAETHGKMFGYHPDNWQRLENQAAFVAHRAHAWTTGELPRGLLSERMYRMALNPHVRDALTIVDEDRLLDEILFAAPQPEVFDQDAPAHGPDQRPSGFVALKDVARNLSEQFMETRKTGRQLSLLGEQDEYDTYDVDKIDWDN